MGVGLPTLAHILTVTIWLKPKHGSDSGLTRIDQNLVAEPWLLAAVPARWHASADERLAGKFGSLRVACVDERFDSTISSPIHSLPFRTTSYDATVCAVTYRYSWTS